MTMTCPSDAHDEVVGQDRGELGDREDEDQVEEQLERGDALHRALRCDVDRGGHGRRA